MRIFLGENKYADPQDFREVISEAANFSHSIELVRWDVNISTTHNLERVRQCDVLLLLTDSTGSSNDGMYSEATIGKGTYDMIKLSKQTYFYAKGAVWPLEDYEKKNLDNWRNYALVSGRIEPHETPKGIRKFFDDLLGNDSLIATKIPDSHHDDEKYESGSDPFADY